MTEQDVSSTRNAVLKVGRVVISQKSETERKNPNSLRFLIGAIINSCFHGSQKEAVEQLARYSGAYRDTHRGHEDFKRMNKKALSEILGDEDHIAYWHLECISNYLGIPTGALLILSRTLSHARYREHEILQAIISDTRRFLDLIEAISKKDSLDTADFEKVRESYATLQKLEAEHPRLFDRL